MPNNRDLHEYVENIERFEATMLGGAAAELINFGILYLKEGHHMPKDQEPNKAISVDEDRWIPCSEVNEILGVEDRSRQRLLKNHGIEPRRGKSKGKKYLLSDIIGLKNKLETEGD